MVRKSRNKAAFGDFQTPPSLAREVCATVARLFGGPRTVIEPTCGYGTFLEAAYREFGTKARLVGVEINGNYVTRAVELLQSIGSRNHTILHNDFFGFDWEKLLANTKQPLLVVGNPPWVTNAELGTLSSTNLPPKSNFQNRQGLDALTGKSNFDISEWMLIRLLEILTKRNASFAMLVKTAVARKVILHAWEHDLALRDPAIFGIDAKQHFGAAVDACLFVGNTSGSGERRCPVYHSMADPRKIGAIGYDEGNLIADIDACRETTHLLANEDDASEWRSGIKHDCAKVIELREEDGKLVNGLGEHVEIEDEVLFPLLKSSDVAKGRMNARRRLIVPQRAVGQSTQELERTAPRAWEYLLRHGEMLDARKSSIYRGRPRFSIFGVGHYSFSPWKVAISGLYKTLDFQIVGPRPDGRPIVFDDTVYFTPCANENEARMVHRLLSSDLARRFYSSFIFWDAKRPVTASVLRKLGVNALAQALGIRAPRRRSRTEESTQLRLIG